MAADVQECQEVGGLTGWLERRFQPACRLVVDYGANIHDGNSHQGVNGN